MTAAISDRRQAALAAARRRRDKGARRRARLVEDVARAPRPLGFYVIAAVTAILVLFGLVMVLSSSSIVSFHRGQSPWTYFKRQLIWALVGSFGMYFAYRVSLVLVQKVARILPMIGIGLMFVSFLPTIGKEENGARAWINLGDYSLQPSEFMKLCLVIYGADLLSRRKSDPAELFSSMKTYLKWVGLAAAISLVQRDLGSGLVIGLIGLAVLFLAGVPVRHVAAVGGTAAVLGVLFVRFDSEKWARLTSFLDLKGTREGDGYQVYQALISVSNGGLTGTGIGAGTGKWGYVPLAYSDFIFSIVAEEMGLLGVLGLLTLFGFLVYFAFQVAVSCRHHFGFLLAGGIACWMLVQVTINIGGVIGLMPVTGLTLPFISFGGSSLITSMVAAGLLMNVARRPR